MVINLAKYSIIDNTLYIYGEKTNVQGKEKIKEYIKLNELS